MADDLTPEEMEEILYLHEIREASLDVDATMETVVDNPHYEFPSGQWAADGQEAVREHYRRALPAGVTTDAASAKRVHGVGPNTLFREATFSFTNEKGERRTGQYMTVIEFDPETKKIKSERQYGDTIFHEFLAPHIGPDYGDTPGVTRLNENVEPVSREAMLAEAEAGAKVPDNWS